MAPETIDAIVRDHAKRQPDAIAFCFEGRFTNYAEFDRNSDRVAAALLAEGLKTGGRVAYLGKNSDRYFELLIGAARAGMVTVPVNWRLAVPEVAFVVADSDAEILFVGPEFIAAAQTIAADLPHLKTLVAMEAGTPGWPTYADWRDAAPEGGVAHLSDVEDVFLQLYTSGTTGNPKGVLSTHANLTRGRATIAAASVAWNQWKADDVGLLSMPVFHIGGTGWGLMSLHAGAKSVVAREFDPAKMFDFIERERITKFFLVPAALQILVRDPRITAIDFSSVRQILYGASPMPLALLHECLAIFTGCDFVQMYGLTETFGTIVALPPEDHRTPDPARMLSAGRALPGTEIRITDGDGRLLPTGEVGEIQIRSVATMRGYWKRPEESAKSLGADNWLRTGDAGCLDAEGYLFIRDRIKDMIISGGENIYPIEVENALCSHPAVAEVAVIGIPDERWGEAVKAVVVLRPDARAGADELIAWAHERIARFKTPRSVDFIDALPRNPSGKILKRELRAPYWAGHVRQVN